MRSGSSFSLMVVLYTDGVGYKMKYSILDWRGVNWSTHVLIAYGSLQAIMCKWVSGCLSRVCRGKCVRSIIPTRYSVSWVVRNKRHPASLWKRWLPCMYESRRVLQHEVTFYHFIFSASFLFSSLVPRYRLLNISLLICWPVALAIWSHSVLLMY